MVIPVIKLYIGRNIHCGVIRSRSNPQGIIKQWRHTTVISLGSCSAGMQSSLSSILFKELDCVRRICQLIGHPSCPLVKTLGGVALCWSAFRFPSRSIILYDNLRTYLLYTVIATVA